MRRRTVLTVALLATLAAREASGDIVHLKSPSTVTTEKGSKVALPAGYFLDEETWAERDAELKAAQADRTRFKAENEVLRKASNDISWKSIAVTFLGGMAVGAVVLQMAK